MFILFICSFQINWLSMEVPKYLMNGIYFWNRTTSYVVCGLNSLFLFVTLRSSKFLSYIPSANSMSTFKVYLYHFKDFYNHNQNLQEQLASYILRCHQHIIWLATYSNISIWLMQKCNPSPIAIQLCSFVKPLLTQYKCNRKTLSLVQINISNSDMQFSKINKLFIRAELGQLTQLLCN